MDYVIITTDILFLYLFMAVASGIAIGATVANLIWSRRLFKD